MSSLLIVGLGNISLPLTRHSIGHYILDSLAWRLGCSFNPHPQFDGFFAEAKGHFSNSTRDVTLFKPRPLMNILGKPVYKALRGTVGDPRRMVVIHDSLNWNPGQTKLSDKAEQYYRLHVGIGRTETLRNRDFVLGPLSSYEKEHFSANGSGIDDVWAWIEEAALKGDEYRKGTPMKRPLP